MSIQAYRASCVIFAVSLGIITGSRGVQAGQVIGLEPGDVILSVNGKMLKNGGDLLAAVRHSPDLMQLTVIDVRTGKLRALQTRLRSTGSARRFGVSTEDRGGRGVTITHVQPSSPASRCETDGEFTWAQAVVQCMLARSEHDDDRIREGSLLVYQWPTKRVAEPGALKYVWRYRAGQVEPSGADVWYQAFGADRSKWPPNTICFAINSAQPQHIVVTVSTFYDCGITRDTRGGNAEQLTLDKEGGEWKVTEQQGLMAWD